MNNEEYIAKTLFGLEEILSDELKSFGASNIRIANRATTFHADLGTLYKINLASRTALRILKPIKNFYAKNPDQLYKKSKDFNWPRLISANDTFAIDCVANSEIFRHSKYAALKLKDAIVDQIRSINGKRPSVDVNNPKYRINLHIVNDQCTISLDSSGESLHKRGYRISGEIAPLNEVLAAGMILLSGWDGKSNFIDPMCGSGTLAIEAALIALNIPPNLYRSEFSFMHWKSFDNNLFKLVKSELITQKKNFPKIIIGNDKSNIVLKSAIANAKRAKVLPNITFTNLDFFYENNDYDSGIIITNPPYGERLKTDNMNDFYKKMGDTFKQNYNGFDAWVLSSNKEALKRLGLRTSRRLTLYNGSLECKYHNYKLFKGSMKKKYD